MGYKQIGCSIFGDVLESALLAGHKTCNAYGSEYLSQAHVYDRGDAFRAMGNFCAQRLIDCSCTHHHESDIGMHRYNRLMFCRGFNHAVPGAIGFDNYRAGSALHEQFIGLSGLKPSEFVSPDDGSCHGDTPVLLPCSADHFEEGRRFSGDDQRAGLIRFGEKYLGGGGGDNSTATLSQFAGEGIHSGCLATRANDRDEWMSR